MKVLTPGSLLTRVCAGAADQAAIAREGVLRLSGLSGSLGAVLLARAAVEGGRLLIVMPDEASSARLRDDLATLLPELAMAADTVSPAQLLFPPLEADPYQGIGPHPQTLAERAATLWRMRREVRWVVVAPAAALWAPLMPVEEFEALAIGLEEGGECEFDDLAGRLEAAGYGRVDMANSPGDWARRGGIFDVYPPGSTAPLRIELEEDRIASLRLFDPLTQRSLEKRVAAHVPPAREAPLNPPALRRLIRRLEKMPRTGGRSITVDPLETLAVEGTFPGVEACTGLWAGRETDLLDYADDAVLAVDEPFRVATELDAAMSELNTAHAATDGVLPGPSRLLLPASRLTGRLAGPRLETHDLALADTPDDPFEVSRSVDVGGRAPRTYFGRLADLAADLVDQRPTMGDCLLLLESDGALARCGDLLREAGLDPVVLPATIPAAGRLPHLALGRGRLRRGFTRPEIGVTVLTEREIFGERRRQRPRGGRRAAPFRSDFRDLSVGDLVVHVDHGIGRYQGIRRLGDGGGNEFMVLVYQEQAVLYVPVDRLDLVQRYTGVGGKSPRIDRLGTPGWEKVRKKIRKQMQVLADDLLDLYATRRAQEGHAFSDDTPWQSEFEAAFPFSETPDQLQAIRDVKASMQKALPMDRLVCGDVGFGKTEVAMRAAFKAVMDGFQVAVLAPTTVLAFQHCNTFRDRFAPFPVRIELLSRFQTRAEQTAIVRGVRDGAVDIVIGTHRLLSKDITFSELGLLVVDEEQRFGVAHKERLKTRWPHVDELTLTATPIPRTLQMSLAGVRDMSVIETPPENRLSIQTLVLPFRPGIVAQAIRREIRRGGQVFFVHNRISSIAAVAHVIRREVPEVTLEVVHGRLPEKDLERIMLRFMAGEFQVLLTTSIIENGLDVPRANTIIIDRADRFGLAELYQLRGRVGRSDVRAYAYLLIPSHQKLTDVARRRLKALQEFSELGAGFRVAARDLEIRGAGDLLGARQHGQIAALGFDLYCRMLEQAIQEKRGEAPVLRQAQVSVEMGVDYRLPESYVAEPHQRLVLYKRVAAAAEADELDRVREEIEDRYGHLPQAAENLLALADLRRHAERLGMVQVEARGTHIACQLIEGAPIDAGRLMDWISFNDGVRFSPGRVLSLPVPADPEHRLMRTRDTLAELAERVVFSDRESSVS
ncbi:MAG: transcription-repair coupling factor [Acidobacteriota bacterium]